jgi:hypothetical protein
MVALELAAKDVAVEVVAIALETGGCEYPLRSVWLEEVRAGGGRGVPRRRSSPRRPPRHGRMDLPRSGPRSGRIERRGGGIGRRAGGGGQRGLWSKAAVRGGRGWGPSGWRLGIGHLAARFGEPEGGGRRRKGAVGRCGGNGGREESRIGRETERGWLVGALVAARVRGYWWVV